MAERIYLKPALRHAARAPQRAGRYPLAHVVPRYRFDAPGVHGRIVYQHERALCGVFVSDLDRASADGRLCPTCRREWERQPLGDDPRA